MFRPCVAAFVLCLIVGTGCSSDKDEASTPPGVTTPPESPPPQKTEPLPEGAKALQAAETTGVLGVAQREVPPLTPGDFVVNGEKRLNTWFLTAERVVFEPGAKLIFSKDAISQRGNLFIVAREIVSKDAERPGTIGWEPPAAPGVPGQAGSASSGTNNNRAEGVAGGPGADGAQGPAGARGSDAPSLTIVSLKFQNPLVVNLIGAEGGPGGQGQHGGPGGVGGPGNPGSQRIYECARGAGNGASGGQGGKGGKGGTGGQGGNGGTFTLIVPEAETAVATRLIKPTLQPGKGGKGGSAGDGGAGGSGGNGGSKSLPYCRDDGSPGPTGSPGQAGSAGDQATDARPGDFFVGSITPDVFNGFKK